MGKRIAIIDAGTNTFHLLIAEITSGEFIELFRKRIFVRLAQNSINKLDSSGQKRAMEALREFRKTMDAYAVDKIHAMGTAALRTAENAKLFLNEVFEQTAIDIQVIKGEDEAKLIAHGVSLVTAGDEEDTLIVDIGGGSVEFIYSSAGNVHFAESLPIGIAVLRTQHSYSNPLVKEEYEKIAEYLDGPLRSIFSRIKEKKFQLIGASGSFETIAQITLQSFDLPNYVEIPVSTLQDILNKIIYSTLAEREAMSYLPETRIDLIIPASILLLRLFDFSGSEKVGVSKFALKEGVIKKYLI